MKHATHCRALALKLMKHEQHCLSMDPIHECKFECACVAMTACLHRYVFTLYQAEPDASKDAAAD